MSEQLSEIKDMSGIDSHLDYQVIVIGAGVSGIYQIKRLADLGVRATVLDANPDLEALGTTIVILVRASIPRAIPTATRFPKKCWMRGIGLRCSPQPETLKYLNFVTDKFDLRKYMQFGCQWSPCFLMTTRVVDITTDDGRQLTTRFVVTGVGVLSTPRYLLEGIDSFQGASFHAADWPHEPLDPTGKRQGL